MNINKIWLVFSPAGRAPHHVHNSLESARTEAKRLARCNLDQSFFVMESVGMARKMDVSYYAYDRNARVFNEDEIPF